MVSSISVFSVVALSVCDYRFNLVLVFWISFGENNKKNKVNSKSVWFGFDSISFIGYKFELFRFGFYVHP